LQDEGKSYPRSSCAACGRGILTGLGTFCQSAISPGYTPEALAASPEVKKLVADAEARGMERAQSLARRLANDSEREAERKDTTAQQRIGLNLVRDTAATLESAFRAEAAAIRRAVEGTGT